MSKILKEKIDFGLGILEIQDYPDNIKTKKLFVYLVNGYTVKNNKKSFKEYAKKLEIGSSEDTFEVEYNVFMESMLRRITSTDLVEYSTGTGYILKPEIKDGLSKNEKIKEYLLSKLPKVKE